MTEKFEDGAVKPMDTAQRSPPDRWVRPSRPEDAPGIIALMRQAGLAPHVDPEQLHWKYWRERTDSADPRSFVLTDGRNLLAHGAAMPGLLRWGPRRARVIHMIDWAARRDAVGAGVQLMKHVGGLTEFLFGVGGSAQTLKIMPLIGYRLCGTVVGYARPLSPLALLRQPTRARWKLGPRFGRTLLWTLAAGTREVGGLAARRIGPDDIEQIAGVLPTEDGSLPFLERPPGFLRHALACPIVPMELYSVERAGRIRGYFVLSFVPGQARLADWWIDSREPSARSALLGLAVDQVKARPGLAELVTWSSDPDISGSLIDCGFRERLTLPIYFRASVGREVPGQGVRVQMLDNDAFYLHFENDELWI